MPFWNEEELARLDKMQSEFLAYEKEATKRMEEIRKRMESFSLPRTSPVSQASHITPTSPAATVTKKRKKRAVEATKIHPHRRPTKPPLTGHKSAHLGCKCRRHWTQPSKRVVINSRCASMPLGVIRVHCGAREVKKRTFVFAWFKNRKENSKKMLEQNVKKNEEELEPRVEGQGGNCAKLELFLGDKEVFRGEG
jgi:hypothetical protein